MQAFKDKRGESWELDLTIGAVRRVLGLTKVDLRDGAAPHGPPIDGEPVSLSARLELDELLLADVLYALVKSQCDQRNVSDEEFFERLDSIEEARRAFFREWLDFFRRRDNRPMVSLLEKQGVFIGRVMERIRKEWDASQAEATLDAMIAQDVETIGTTVGQELTSLPGSAGSTPTDLPSVPS